MLLLGTPAKNRFGSFPAHNITCNNLSCECRLSHTTDNQDSNASFLWDRQCNTMFPISVIVPGRPRRKCDNCAGIPEAEHPYEVDVAKLRRQLLQTLKGIIKGSLCTYVMWTTCFNIMIVRERLKYLRRTPSRPKQSALCSRPQTPYSHLRRTLEGTGFAFEFTSKDISEKALSDVGLS
jgi:hypothetical protein